MSFPSHTIQANGINLHYYRSGGDKLPLVLLHGFTDDGACWFPVTDSLAQDYDLIMPDVRGHGKSARVTEIGFHRDALVEDSAALIAALNLNRPAVLGHSLGAMTALRLAAQYPDRLSCVLLEDPPLQAPPTPEAEAERLKGWLDWANNLRWMQTLSHEELVAEGHKRSPNWSDSEIQTWAEAKQQVDAAVFEERSLLPEWRPLMAQAQCPLLLLYGDTSIVNEATAQEATGLWQNGQAVQIMDAGHCIRRDQPAEFLEVVHAFLREHYAAAGQ